VPFPPGGVTDVMARLVGQQLGARWGVNVVVDNRSGNGGQIGADLAAKAPGDGYTLLAITLTHAANATLFKGRSPYDLQRDLRAVALLAGSPMLVVVPTASPIRDFQGLVAQARTRRLNAGSSGNGTPPHLTLALFNELAKTDIQHVPYKGGAPSMVDLIGGQIDVIFSNLPESIAHVKAGKLRALAVTTPRRSAAVPELPTIAESGGALASFDIHTWFGLFGPAKLPAEVTQRLNKAFVEALATPELKARLATLMAETMAGTPEQFGAFVKAELAKYEGVVKRSGAKVD